MRHLGDAAKFQAVCCCRTSIPRRRQLPNSTAQPCGLPQVSWLELLVSYGSKTISPYEWEHDQSANAA